MTNRQPSLSEEFNQDLTKSKARGGKGADLGVEWMTPEIQDLFDDIPDPWRTKKRNTILQLVYATVSGTPTNDVFKLPNVCSKVIWSTKWQHDPTIKAALSASLEAAHRWATQETVRVKEVSRRKREEAIANNSLAAAKALLVIFSDANQPAKDRIEAAKLTLQLADPPQPQVSKSTVSIETAPAQPQSLDLSQLSNEVIMSLLELARANEQHNSDKPA